MSSSKTQGDLRELPNHARRLADYLLSVISDYMPVAPGTEVATVEELAAYVDELVELRLPFYFVREFDGSATGIEECASHRDGVLHKLGCPRPGVRPAGISDLNLSSLIFDAFAYLDEPTRFMRDPSPPPTSHPEACAAAYAIQGIWVAQARADAVNLADAIALAAFVLTTIRVAEEVEATSSIDRMHAAAVRWEGDTKGQAMQKVKAAWMEMRAGKTTFRSDAKFARDMMKDFGNVLSEGGIKNAISRWRRGEK